MVKPKGSSIGHNIARDLAREEGKREEIISKLKKGNYIQDVTNWIYYKEEGQTPIHVGFYTEQTPSLARPASSNVNKAIAINSFYEFCLDNSIPFDDSELSNVDINEVRRLIKLSKGLASLVAKIPGGTQIK